MKIKKRSTLEHNSKSNQTKISQKIPPEEKKRYLRLMESTNIIPWESDAQTGKFTYIGPQAEKTFGYPLKDWYSDTFWVDHIHPEDREWALNYCLIALKTKKEYEFEYRMLTKTGKEIWLRDIVTVTTNTEGKKVLSGFFIDITEQKKAEDLLKASEERFRALTTATSDVIYRMSPDWSVMRELQGRKFLADTGKPVRNWLKKYIPPKEQKHVMNTIKEAIHTKNIFQLEHQVKQADGTLGWTFSKAIPILDQKGKVTEWFGAASNITKRKHAEEALKNAITLRDNFISVASHELKTPVTSVKIFTQVLQQHSEQIGDERAKKHLEKMDKQLNKLTELIYDLLNVSKIQAGRMEFKEKEFNFDDIIKEVIDVLQAGETKHKLIIKGKTNKKVYADEDRISQVLSNLVANAIKYSPKADKVIIHLSSNNKNVSVCVEDFGIGLAKKHLGKIFERFYRVFDTTDKTFPGLGIGLYISSEIIKRHHGKLWVESNTRKGSKFHFSLPLKHIKK